MTMHHIATQTLTSNGTFGFTSIPQTYTHLQLRVNARAVGGDGNLYGGFNNATGSPYSYHILYGDGSTVGSYGLPSRAELRLGDAAPNISNAAIFCPTIIDIFDYANTNKNKTFKSLSGLDYVTAGFTNYRTGAWFSTDAINRIDIYNGGLFTPGSVASLYGITSNPVATGV